MERYFMYNKIRHYRIESGYSQKELADLIGVKQNTISSYENGSYGVSAYYAGLICKVLNKKFEEVFMFQLKDISRDFSGVKYFTTIK